MGKVTDTLVLYPFDLEEGKGSWRHGKYVSVDGVETQKISEDDVEAILFHWKTPQDWDGSEAVVMLLKNAKLVAYETSWGPTGDGFSEDAYGGDADIYFAHANNLSTLVKLALSEEARRLMKIPEELWKE